MIRYEDAFKPDGSLKEGVNKITYYIEDGKEIITSKEYVPEGRPKDVIDSMTDIEKDKMYEIVVNKIKENYILNPK